MNNSSEQRSTTPSQYVCNRGEHVPRGDPWMHVGGGVCTFPTSVFSSSRALQLPSSLPQVRLRATDMRHLSFRDGTNTEPISFRGASEWSSRCMQLAQPHPVDDQDSTGGASMYSRDNLYLFALWTIPTPPPRYLSLVSYATASAASAGH